MKNLPKLKIYIGIIIGIVAVAIVGTTYLLSRHTESYSGAIATRRDLTETVSVTGSVIPDQSVSLTFDLQGKIAEVNVQAGDIVHAGDILAKLDASSVQAQLDGAEADLSAAQAQLDKLEKGAGPEELALYSQKYTDASSALIVAMNNAYLETEDAILSKADDIFINGNTVNPTINIRTQSQDEKTMIDMERIAVKEKLDAWNNAVSQTTSSTSSLETARSVAADSLKTAQDFLSDLGIIAGNLTTGNSGTAQSSIDAYRAVVNGASQEATGASNAFTAADAAWSAARDALTLENAGAQSEDIQAQTAVVAKAQAGVEGYQSELKQSYVTAPFDGTITHVNMKVGGIFVPGMSSDQDIGLISASNLKIEGYMPETDIGIVDAGDTALVTFDAYGSGITFPATVSLIDPAETTQNGVNSYKVTLRFPVADARIKSGLTANAVIMAATATDAISVPSSAIITKSSQTFVMVKQKDGSFIEQLVHTGMSSSDGYTEITGGLDEGAAVASFGASSNN
jgi:HlyD family secretion protein